MIFFPHRISIQPILRWTPLRFCCGIAGTVQKNLSPFAANRLFFTGILPNTRVKVLRLGLIWEEDQELDGYFFCVDQGQYLNPALFEL